MEKELFCKNMSNWDNYKLLLWLALEETKGDIIELGCGDGSTMLLQQYSKEKNRQLSSYDYNKEWADKFRAVHITDWAKFDFSKKVSVVLVDESPGEQRKISIEKLKDHAEIIIVHDSEPAGWNASDYQVRPLFKQFKYAIDIPSPIKNGAWATALSNTIDITKWVGEKLGDYEIKPLQ